MENYIAAIDLGTTKVVALVGKKTEFGKIQITASYDIQSSGIQRGEVQNVLQVTNLIKSSIEEIRNQSGINFSEIYIGIAGQHIKCIGERGDILRDNPDNVITTTEIEALKNKMYSLRMDPGESILHVIPQSYNVDDKLDVQDPVGMPGRRIEGTFHIVIGKTESAHIVERCVNNTNANLQLKRLILEPLASASAVLTEDEKEAGVVMVDIGGGTTDLVVYYDNIVRHTAVIPFGGNVITNDIKEGCGVLQRQAESMKVQFGSCLGELAPDNKIITIPGISGREPREISFKSLAKIIEARMEEIIGAVMFEIDRSGFADKLNAGIVFTGGGAMLEHLPQLVKLKTGMDVRIGRPLYLTSDSGSELQHPSYSTAVGLIMKGFEYEEKHAKELQDEKDALERKAREQQRQQQIQNEIQQQQQREEEDEEEPVMIDVKDDFEEKKEKKRKEPRKNPFEGIKKGVLKLFDLDGNNNA